MMKNLLILCVLLYSSNLFAQQLYSATDSVILNTENSSPGNDWGRGFEFTPNVNLYVAKIGKRVPAPGTYNYAWKIWEVGTQMEVYAQTSSSTIPAQYTYEDVNAPITLTAGVTYALTLYGSGPYYYESNSQVNSNLTYGTMRYCNSCPAQDYPTNTLGGYHYGTPDFLFSLTPLCNTVDTLNEISCETYTSPSNNYTWTTSGTYYDTIPNASGCDSLLTINLTIDTNSVSTQNEVACISYTSPSGNYTWTTSGIYLDTLASANGCDSILTIDLTVTSIDVTTSVSGITISSNGNGTYQWLDCDNGNAWINGETSQTFTPTANGNYAVVVSNNNCSDTSACVTIATIGLNELDNNFSLQVSPNPTDGLFTVHLSSPKENTIIRVIDMLGNSVYESLSESGKILINLSNQEKGMYFVQISSEGTVLTEKVILK